MTSFRKYPWLELWVITPTMARLWVIIPTMAGHTVSQLRAVIAKHEAIRFANFNLLELMRADCFSAATDRNDGTLSMQLREKLFTPLYPRNLQNPSFRINGLQRSITNA